MISGTIAGISSFTVYPLGEITILRPSYSYYYISYTPSSAAGTMWIAASSLATPVSYNLLNYRGMLNFGNSYPKYLSFESCNWSSIETNIPTFNEYLTFAKCSTLQNADLYNCTSLSIYAFQSCSRLTNVKIPKLVSLPSQTFYTCSSLSRINLPNCTYVNETAFKSCYSLSYAILPNVSYVGRYAFNSCFSLYSADLRNIQIIGEGAFENCSRLYFSTPLYKCNVIGEKAFWGCIALTSLILPSISSISSNAFWGCTNLTLWMSGTYVCSLNSSALYNCQLRSIYVRPSLVSVYRTRPYWSSFSAIIQSYPGL